MKFAAKVKCVASTTLKLKHSVLLRTTVLNNAFELKEMARSHVCREWRPQPHINWWHMELSALYAPAWPWRDGTSDSNPTPNDVQTCIWPACKIFSVFSIISWITRILSSHCRTLSVECIDEYWPYVATWCIILQEAPSLAHVLSLNYRRMYGPWMDPQSSTDAGKILITGGRTCMNEFKFKRTLAAVWSGALPVLK